MPETKYKRILLKLSGEALGGEKGFGIDENVLKNISSKIQEIVSLNVQVAIVVGGGNFWRGRNNLGIERTTTDYIGMLATTMNSLALKDALECQGIKTKVLSSINMNKIAEEYTTRNAIEYLENNNVVIFAGGTGNPFFTTDTAAALRAVEIKADVILLAKTADGIYSADPKEDVNAVKYDNITYSDILNKELKVMDSTATSLCKDNNMPLVVFGIKDPENIVKAVKGETIGTIVK